ncbi:recombinase family protein [Tumebacillus flagellatus]|uniref:Recombinase n=1 Tax=Tumebacillus flagellatus TaxID=1157490 RepID=A0A074LRN0_9BACL|nr:recombinase family protein [Tumebacillus flagellatus]KEO84796.1 hypothetical protein EL26_01945 [Tumebacillus flagellatus]
MKLLTGLNVIIYLRKSRADQEAEARGEGETLAKHRRVLLEFAKHHKIKILHIFEELLSGDRIVDRPEMQKVLHAVADKTYNGNHIDGVLIMDIDRLGRGNKIDQGIIEDTFKESGVLIITPRKVYDSQDEYDEEAMENETFFSRKEFKRINRRLQNGRKDSVNDGKHIAKKPPYGYERGSDLKLRPDPDTAKIVRMIFNWTADDRLGHKAIAGRLTDMGVKTPSGKKIWPRSAIARILKNEVYLGTVIWGKTRIVKSPYGGYQQIPTLDRDKWTIKENAHEPLVTRELFERANEVGASRPLPVPKDKRLTNPLAGLIFCSECGFKMRRQPNPKYEAFLICTTRGCKNKQAQFQLVEGKLLNSLRLILLEIEVSLEESKDTSEVERALLLQTIKNYEKDISETKNQISRVHDLLEKNVYSIEQYLERNDELAKRIEKLQQDIGNVKIQLSVLDERADKMRTTIPEIANVLAEYGEISNPESRNQMLKGIIDKITYTRKPEWKDPHQFELDVHLKI